MHIYIYIYIYDIHAMLIIFQFLSPHVDTFAIEQGSFLQNDCDNIVRII